MKSRQNNDVIRCVDAAVEENAFGLPRRVSTFESICDFFVAGLEQIEVESVGSTKDACGRTLESSMLYLTDLPSAQGAVGRRLHRSRAPISDDLVVEALQPLDVLQIGCRGQVLDSDDGASAVRSVGSLHEAMGIIAEHEFDALVLGLHVADAWPTAAYEQVAMLAGPTPVVVQTDHVGPMAAIKQRHDREQDVIVATANPSLLARLILAAILRRRALAEESGTHIG